MLGALTCPGALDLKGLPWRQQGATCVPNPIRKKAGVTNGADSIFSISFWKDLAERVIRTFVQSFLAALIAGGTLNISVPTVKAAVIGAISAAIAVVMGMMAGPVGKKGTASVLSS